MLCVGEGSMPPEAEGIKSTIDNSSVRDGVKSALDSPLRIAGETRVEVEFLILRLNSKNPRTPPTFSQLRK